MVPVRVARRLDAHLGGETGGATREEKSRGSVKIIRTGGEDEVCACVCMCDACMHVCVCFVCVWYVWAVEPGQGEHWEIVSRAWWWHKVAAIAPHVSLLSMA